MKHMRKILSLLLALVMVLGLATTALAADGDGTATLKEYTFKIQNSATGHNYVAYQVFKGDYDEQSKVLTNIDWGSGVVADGDDGLLKYLVDKYDSCKDCTTAINVADVLKADKVENFSNAVAGHLGTAAGSATAPDGDGYYNIKVTGDGYYFIQDEANLADKNEVATKYIMLVTKEDVTIVKVKGDVPTLTKKVDDVNDTPDGTSSGSNSDSASYDIGDDVPFHLNITIPTDVKDYSEYQLEITDTLSKGLTYNSDAKVTKAGVDVTDKFTINSATNADGGTTLTIACADIKETDGLNISDMTNLKVDYTAKLNENAVTGGSGNENKAFLKFSNDPYKKTLGKTPEDKVVVFTFKVIINKVTTGDQALTGAAFKLEKQTGADTWTEVGNVDITDPANDAISTFTFNGLDNGIYRLTETRTPAGYNSIKPITFRIWAIHDGNSEDPKLTDLHATGEITLTPNMNDGSLTGKVMNKPGNTLPETGGIGTTIFYVVGVILVLGAGVLLVTKKRTAKR